MRWHDRVLLGLALAAVAGFSFLRPSPVPRVDVSALQAELSQIKEELAKPRCVIVQTPVFNLYDIPNLGVKKVRKP